MISVILPVLNEERSIARTLRALVGQPSLEVIVVDGGSQDATRAVVATFEGVRVVACGRANRGAQMNAGARVATGEVLLFLHADAVLPEAGLSVLEATLKDPRVGGGCFQICFPADAPRQLRLVAWGINLRTRLFITATGDQGIFLRRALFEHFGGYQELPLMEDIELFNALKRVSRAVVLGAKIEISPRRWLKHGIWRTVIWMYLLRAAYWLGANPATLKRLFVDVR